MKNWTHTHCESSLIFMSDFSGNKKRVAWTLFVKTLDVLVGMLLLQEWKFFQVHDCDADSVRIVQ